MNDYFYSNEIDMFIFYRIPKVLFTDGYASLDCEAKVLYGLLLDRNSLSIKNNWTDDLNRVYIYFERAEAEELLGVKKEKSIKLFRLLEQYDLIEDVRQGRGKPNRIYVKKAGEGLNGKPKSKKSEKQISEKQSSKLLKNRHLEVGKTDHNNNELNNFKFNNNKSDQDEFEIIDDMINFYSSKYELPFQSTLNVFDRCMRQKNECGIEKSFTTYFERALGNEKLDYRVTKFIH